MSAVRACEVSFDVVGEGEFHLGVGPPLLALAACEVVDVFYCVLVGLRHAGVPSVVSYKIFEPPRLVVCDVAV